MTGKGIARHMDSTQDMGFNTVWISLGSATLKGATAYGETQASTIGEWPQRPRAGAMHARVRTLCRRIHVLDEGPRGVGPPACFGTAEDLRELSGELHRRGMTLVLRRRRRPHARARELLPAVRGVADASYFHARCFVSQGGGGRLPLQDLTMEAARMGDLLSHASSEVEVSRVEDHCAHCNNTAEFWLLRYLAGHSALNQATICVDTGSSGHPTCRKV